MVIVLSHQRSVLPRPSNVPGSSLSHRWWFLVRLGLMPPTISEKPRKRKTVATPAPDLTVSYSSLLGASARPIDQLISSGASFHYAP